MTSRTTEQARRFVPAASQNEARDLNSQRASSFLDASYSVLSFPLEVLGVFRFLNWADAFLARQTTFSNQAPHIAGPNQVPPSPG
jgi:hypothetical protein